MGWTPHRPHVGVRNEMSSRVATHLRNAVVVALLLTGCATSSSSSTPARNVEGPWVGAIAIRSGDLGSTGARDGQLRVVFEQHGSAITGSVDGPGLRGSIHATLRGEEFTGTAALQVVLGA